MYIVTITYNFDSDYVAKKCSTMEKAVKILHDYLNKEIETVKTEEGYNPSVLKWEEDDITLVYVEGYTIETESKKYATEDCAYYRIFEV